MLTGKKYLHSFIATKGLNLLCFSIFAPKPN